MHGRYEKYVQNFGQESQKGRDHLEDLGINGKIILEVELRDIECEVVDWICLA
jgi:hypothetical protein